MFCSKCGTKIADDALFCYKCGNKIANVNTVDKSTVPVNTNQYSSSEIKEYLYHAKALEANRYTLALSVDKLQSKINSLGRKKNILMPTSEARFAFYKFWPAFWSILAFGVFITVLSGDAISNIISMITVILIFFNSHLLVGFGISLAVALVGGIIVGTISVMVKRSKYKRNLKQYKKDVDNDEKRVAKEKEQIQALKKQQIELNGEIAKIDSILKKFYSIGVVYPKYREMIPIITLFEYFDSGRCQDLPSAYNMYESELRQNIIISKLDQALFKLDQIRNSQYALYESIQESNAIADRIYYQSEQMLASNRAIEKNSEIAAYNAKIAADNSSISAYIDVCRF